MLAHHLHISKSRRTSTFNGRKPFPFGHNLCFKYLNASWKPILDIYVLRVFQWYKKIFNSMSFGPYNRLLKIQKSIETPTPKVRNLLGVHGFPHILLHSQEYEMWLHEFHSWPTPLQAVALVMNPRLRLRHVPTMYKTIKSCSQFFS
jgi:hypothetical protein